MISGFPNEFAQVILNVLLNARDILDSRNVDDARISIDSFVQAGATVVVISDNGGGIDDEILTRIFDPYFTTKGPEHGSGIGLYMSKVIIEKNMGGSLTVCNNIHGAEFRIEVKHGSH
jgi:signal transduction histidine kinase